MPTELRDVLVIVGATLGAYLGARVNKRTLRRMIDVALHRHAREYHRTAPEITGEYPLK